MACVALLEKRERVKRNLPWEHVPARSSEQQALASTSQQLAHSLAEGNEGVATERERGIRPTTAVDMPQSGAGAQAEELVVADAAVPQRSSREGSTNPALGSAELGERASQPQGKQAVLASEEQLRPVPPAGADRETHRDSRREDQAQLGERMGPAALTQGASTHNQLMASSVHSVAPPNGQSLKTAQVEKGATHKVPKVEGMASPNNRRPATQPLAHAVSDLPASNGAPHVGSTPTPKSAGVPAAMAVPMSGHAAQRLPAAPKTGWGEPLSPCPVLHPVLLKRRTRTWGCEGYGSSWTVVSGNAHI